MRRRDFLRRASLVAAGALGAPPSSQARGFARPYDVIIVGAGAAGSIVARRLVDRFPRKSILLLEAGGPTSAGCIAGCSSCWRSGRVGVGSGVSSDEGVQLTPIFLHVARPPIPVLGSDGRYHIVYQLEVTNMTRRPAIIRQVDVLDATSGNIVQSLGADAVAGRLVVRQADPTPATLRPFQYHATGSSGPSRARPRTAASSRRSRASSAGKNRDGPHARRG